MEKKVFEDGRFTVLDGGMGTMLQASGLMPGQRPEEMCITNPETVKALHKAYVDAGSHVICANTFGANARKLAGSGYSVQSIVEAAVKCARAAAKDRAMVALDVGPIGELLEPVGLLSFEEAYEIFAQVMKAGALAGAELIIVETMTDLLEVKAAVLAATENTGLPVLASMTFEADGRTFAGVPVEAFASVGGLGVQALGINCSLGPDGIMPLLVRLRAATPLPIYAKPNAGLPNPATGEYAMRPQEFCDSMAQCVENGVSAVGGCCGTTPAFIALLAPYFLKKSPRYIRGEAVKFCPAAPVCGPTAVLKAGGVVAVGERINPTGKKQLQAALRAGDYSYIQTLAVQQEAAGADVLDVNVGAPGVDEVLALPKAVRAVQAVCGLPLMIDSANPAALAAALRVYAGKAIVNSTSGEEGKLAAVLPLCKRYGAAVVGLTLDDNGIPPDCGGRLAIAGKIKERAKSLGITGYDVWIDCLTLTVGAQPNAAAETLRCIQVVSEMLWLKTVLGVSNVSFGMPNRPLLNRTFLAMALAAGLDAAIINTADSAMMDTVAAVKILRGAPEGADAYLARCAAADSVPGAAGISGADSGKKLMLKAAIIGGLKTEAAAAARAWIEEYPAAGLTLVNDELAPALDEVGKRFEEKTLFLPQLLASSSAAQAAFEVVRKAMGEKEQSAGVPVVLATVQGDIHDIGKNIVKALLENYGFTVIDLGRDVPPQRVVEAAKENGAGLVGLSALMTTTLPAMERTVRALREAALPCKVLVGGAVLTEEYAATIGADYYAKDAKSTVDYARRLFGQL